MKNKLFYTIGLIVLVALAFAAPVSAQSKTPTFGKGAPRPGMVVVETASNPIPALMTEGLKGSIQTGNGWKLPYEMKVLVFRARRNWNEVAGSYIEPVGEPIATLATCPVLVVISGAFQEVPQDCVTRDGYWTLSKRLDQDYYMIRVLAKGGWYHPSYQEVWNYHSGGVTEFDTVQLQRFSILVSDFTLNRWAANRVYAEFQLANNSEWQEPVVIRIKLRGPSYTTIDAPLADGQPFGGWLEPWSQTPVWYYFGIPSWTGSNGKGKVCGQLEISSGWQYDQGWVYAQQDVCIDAYYRQPKG